MRSTLYPNAPAYVARAVLVPSEISPLFASASSSASSTKASSDSSISNMLRPLATSWAVIAIGTALMLLCLPRWFAVYRPVPAVPQIRGTTAVRATGHTM